MIKKNKGKRFTTICSKEDLESLTDDFIHVEQNYNIKMQAKNRKSFLKSIDKTR